MKRNSFVAAFSVAFAATLSVGFVNVTPKVIYGEDNRHDVYQLQRADIRDIADSTVALIPVYSLVNNGQGLVDIKTDQFGREMNLCKDEAFYEQPTAANCSGSLVGADLIATAGHCVSTANCDRYAYVFGFKMLNEGSAQVSVAEEEVYSCKEIVAREYSNGADYALVRLDRPVRGHRILSLQKQPVKAGDDIFVVGHPAGLPTKVTDGARVRSQKGSFFTANLDTYGGNSGSAVFNAATNEVVGILVRGENDFAYDNAKQCMRSNLCSDGGCRGEDVTNISYISQALPN